MTLPAFASTDDLAARVPGGLNSNEETQARAQAALDDASALIRAEASKTWVTDDNLDDDVPDIVATICIAAARRAMIAPEGLPDDAGPFSVSVYLTRRERQLVRKAAGRAGLWTLPTTRGPAELDAVYVDVVGSDKPLPVEPPLPEL